MAKTPSERMEDLAEAMRKLTDTDERLVKVQEERLVEARKVEQQAQSWDKLGEQLRESLLAPLKGLASMIPAPLRILGKMAIAKPMKAHLARKQERLQASALEAGEEEPSLGGALTPSLAGVASAVTGGKLGATDDPDSRWGQMVEAFAGINSTLEMIAEASLELFHLEDISDSVGELATAGGKKGSIQVHDAGIFSLLGGVEEKLEEIDENTEPKKVSKAKIREDELEARKKKPGVATIKKLGPVALDWKKLLMGLAMMGGAFGIAKAISFWQDVIIPAGGFQKWWKDSGWPTMRDWAKDLGVKIINAIGGILGIPEGGLQLWWATTASPLIEGWLKTTGLAMITAAGAALIKYVDENKEGWIAQAKVALGNIGVTTVLAQIAGTALGVSIGASIGSKIGMIFGGPIGAVVGVLVGAAVGGIMGYFSVDIMKNLANATKPELDALWKLKMGQAGWGAVVGAAMAGALVLAPFSAGLSIPAAIAIVLVSAAVSGLFMWLTGTWDTKDPLVQDRLELERLRAEVATKSWLERNVWDPIGNAIDAVAGFGKKITGKSVVERKREADLEILQMQLGIQFDEGEREKIRLEIEELQALIKGGGESASPKVLQGGTRFGTDNRPAVPTTVEDVAAVVADATVPNPVISEDRDRANWENWLKWGRGAAGPEEEMETRPGGEMVQTKVPGARGIGSRLVDEWVPLEGTNWGRDLSETIEHSKPAIRTDLGQALGVSHGKLTSHGFSAKDYVEKGSMGSVGKMLNIGKSMLDGGTGSLSMSGSADLGDGVSGSAGFSVTGGGSGSSVGISGDFERVSLASAPVWSGQGASGGDVNNNSVANVNTTNISQGKTRDVGMALSFIKTKNSRLGYAVSS